VRRLPSPASGGSAPREPSKESARRPSPVEGTSSSGRSDALTCSGGNGLTRSSRCYVGTRQRSTLGRPREVSEGSTRQSRSPADKAAAPSPTPRASPGVVASWPEAGICAVEREAVGGRMTARWSGVASGIRAASCGRAPKGGLDVERWRVSHNARQRVSRGDVCHGCSWRETSVVETDSRHLGAVSKERPQGPTRCRAERRTRPVTRNGAGGH